jgi:hypothetical protein
MLGSRMVMGCLGAVVLVASGCGGSAAPTAPSGGEAAGATHQTAASEPAAQMRASSPIQALLLTKVCLVEAHCTVYRADADGLFPVGTDIFYTGPLLENRTTSGIVITTPDGSSTASGHCSLSYKSGRGTCVLTGGTGELAGIHGNVKVTADFSVTPAEFTWTGEYHFSRNK